MRYRGGGGGGGGGGLKKRFFQPFGPQFGIKIRARTSSLDLPLVLFLTLHDRSHKQTCMYSSFASYGSESNGSPLK